MFSAFGCCSVCEAAVAKRRRKGVSKPVTAPTEPACSLQGRRLHGTSPLVSQPRGGSPSCSFLPNPHPPARASAGRAGDSQSPPCFAEPGLGGGKRGQAHQRGGPALQPGGGSASTRLGGSTCPALLRNTQSRAGDSVNAGKSPDRTPRRRREPADREPARSRSASSPRKDTQASTTGAQRHAPRTAKSKRLTMTRAEKAAERVRGSHAAGGSFGARPL